MVLSYNKFFDDFRGRRCEIIFSMSLRASGAFDAGAAKRLARDDTSVRDDHREDARL